MVLSPQARPQSWHRVFDGSISEISAAANWIESIAAELSLPDTQAFAMQLCLEELMSNTVRHGRKSSKPDDQKTNSTHPLSISVTVEALPGRVAMSIEDNGCSFDVEQAPAKPIDRPLDRVETGGLGIYLIKNFSTNLHYTRTETGNRVMVEFSG